MAKILTVLIRSSRSRDRGPFRRLKSARLAKETIFPRSLSKTVFFSCSRVARSSSLSWRRISISPSRALNLLFPCVLSAVEIVVATVAERCHTDAHGPCSRSPGSLPDRFPARTRPSWTPSISIIRIILTSSARISIISGSRPLNSTLTPAVVLPHERPDLNRTPGRFFGSKAFTFFFTWSTLRVPSSIGAR